MISSAFDINQITRLLRSVFPGRPVGEIVPLTGGLININLKITFESGEAPVVLRVYRRDPTVCRQEVEVLRLLRQTVPVPELIHSAPDGIDGSGPFSILGFVEGLTFQQLKRTNNLDAIHQAAASVGETLAAIGRFKFEKPGRLVVTTDQRVSVGVPYIEGPDPIPRILDSFLTSDDLRRRVSDSLVEELHAFIWKWATLLPDLSNDSFLVHSDFGNRNILVKEVDGKWKVAAVLDWEFAFSGSPLLDVGHFLRYEKVSAPLREPFFSRAFVENGGSLPDNWRNASRVIDLTALVELLTHPYLPDDVASEILELIHATLNECQPS